MSFFSRFFGGSFFSNVDLIIAGLGNPGPQYQNTRHNVGFIVVDSFLKDTVHSGSRLTCQSSAVTSPGLSKEKTAFIKPLTFMNKSGDAIKEVCIQTKLPASACCVVVDDFNLPLGQIRFRRGGSDGGHNGLKSIIGSIGPDFVRMRIGIGPLAAGVSVIDFVLGNFDQNQISIIDSALPRFHEALRLFCKEGIDAAMNKYNKQSHTAVES